MWVYGLVLQVKPDVFASSGHLQPLMAAASNYIAKIFLTLTHLVSRNAVRGPKSLLRILSCWFPLAFKECHQLFISFSHLVWLHVLVTGTTLSSHRSLTVALILY